MDLIRSLVSGKKKRLREEGYDLDLSYITPRIMAMALPGEGLEKLYRNSADTVAKFFRERHPGAFRVFNLSGLRFDYGKFGDSVVEYPWLDHHSPPIDLLFKACEDMHRWLAECDMSVIAVNCKAGKGRTGTLICCYLMFCGRFTDPTLALEYYRVQRFTRGGGVTQPSQRRYVYYFWKVLCGEVKGPLLKLFSKVIFHTAPHMKNHTCRPFLTISYNDVEIYSTKESTRNRNLKLRDEWARPQDHYLLIRSSLEVKGDLQFRLFHWGRMGDCKICRFAINTAFIPRDDVYTLRKEELDPDCFVKSSKVSDAFCLHLVFQSLCRCTADLDLADRCAMCRESLGLEELRRWESVQAILASLQAQSLDYTVLLFGAQRCDDVDEVLQQSQLPKRSASPKRTAERDNSST